MRIMVFEEDARLFNSWCKLKGKPQYMSFKDLINNAGTDDLFKVKNERKRFGF